MRTTRRRRSGMSASGLAPFIFVMWVVIAAFLVLAILGVHP